MRFRDRDDAGERLADAVVTAGLDLVDPVVLALPRGGVPVAAAVARRLGAPLDVFVARKVGAPGRPELGIGAVAEGGATVGVGPDEPAAALARAELARRVEAYRGDRSLPALAGRDVVLVDDGLATGVTAEAAILGVRRCQPRPRRVILAVPVGAPDTVARLGAPGLAHEVVCVHSPWNLRAVGEWYDDFTQTSDEEVRRLLAGS